MLTGISSYFSCSYVRRLSKLSTPECIGILLLTWISRVNSLGASGSNTQLDLRVPVWSREKKSPSFPDTMQNSNGGPFFGESLSLTDSFSRVLPGVWVSWRYGEKRWDAELNTKNTNTPATKHKTVTCMMAVELDGVKTGGLSLTSEMSMFKVTVEDMAGEPLSNACTDKEYLDT